MALLVNKMKAAILVAQNEPLVIDEVDLPDRLEVGQVLVKVHFSGICGSQLGEIAGVKGKDRYLPHLLGHEGGAEVVQVGTGVSTVRDGQKVVMHWREGKGMSAPAPTYQWRGRTLNAGWVTTFNEYAVVAENRLTPWPDDIPLSLAPLFGCALTTGLGVIGNNAALGIGESIVIFGAGGVGLNMVQGACMVSAYPIIAVDRFDNRLALASTLGASHVLNAHRCNLTETIQQILGAPGVDVAVDNTGVPEIIETAYGLLNPQGRLVLVGVPRHDRDIRIHTLPLHFGKRIIGSHGGDAVPHRDIPRFIRLFKAGKIALDPLITDRFELGEINTAVAGMQSGRISGRCLIDMSHSGRR